MPEYVLVPRVYDMRAGRGAWNQKRETTSNNDAPSTVQGGGAKSKEIQMDNRVEITVQEIIADDITETIKECYDVLFNVCTAFGMDWKPYCATLMRDLADHVEL